MSRFNPATELHLNDQELLVATPDQIVFIDQVRELLDRLGVHGLDQKHTEAAIWSGDVFHGSLLILLPLAHSPHIGIQVQMTPSMILGTWDDKHYIWDSTREGEEDLRVEGVDEQSRSEALVWLEHEMRRPATRRECRWGPFKQTTWQHDDDDSGWTDSEGFLPIRPPGTQCLEAAAGYLDEVPTDS